MTDWRIRLATLMCNRPLATVPEHGGIEARLAVLGVGAAVGGEVHTVSMGVIPQQQRDEDAWGQGSGGGCGWETMYGWRRQNTRCNTRRKFGYTARRHRRPITASRDHPRLHPSTGPQRPPLDPPSHPSHPCPSRQAQVHPRLWLGIRRREYVLPIQVHKDHVVQHRSARKQQRTW
jgi:hypothetical protein